MRSAIRSSRNGSRISVSLVLSYIFDWVTIVAAAGIGGAFYFRTPNKRPFSLSNPEISFPFQTHEKISTAVLIVCSLAIPAGVIFAVCLFLVPGPTVPKSTPSALIWRRKLWEWHTGWLGLGLSLAVTFLITNGMKTLFGKPRPDLLSRCAPDLTKVADYRLGGYLGTDLVSADICTNTDASILNDGFCSFPSGHSSFSAAGLIYLSLFICSKLAVTIPYLAPTAYSQDESRHATFPSRAPKGELSAAIKSATPIHEPTGHNDAIIGARNQAAGPPLYLLVFATIPFLASVYISSTRYSDFRHHGFDILFGYLIGATTAIFSFRYYHLPISQGAGWSWGPRSRDRSFWAGVGVGNYVGTKVTNTVEGRTESDPEMGPQPAVFSYLLNNLVSNEETRKSQPGGDKDNEDNTSSSNPTSSKKKRALSKRKAAASRSAIPVNVESSYFGVRRGETANTNLSLVDPAPSLTGDNQTQPELNSISNTRPRKSPPTKTLESVIVNQTPLFTDKQSEARRGSADAEALMNQIQDTTEDEGLSQNNTNTQSRDRSSSRDPAIAEVPDTQVQAIVDETSSTDSDTPLATLATRRRLLANVDNSIDNPNLSTNRGSTRFSIPKYKGVNAFRAGARVEPLSSIQQSNSGRGRTMSENSDQINSQLNAGEHATKEGLAALESFIDSNKGQDQRDLSQGWEVSTVRSTSGRSELPSPVQHPVQRRKNSKQPTTTAERRLFVGQSQAERMLEFEEIKLRMEQQNKHGTSPILPQNHTSKLSIGASYNDSPPAVVSSSAFNKTFASPEGFSDNRTSVSPPTLNETIQNAQRQKRLAAAGMTEHNLYMNQNKSTPVFHNRPLSRAANLGQEESDRGRRSVPGTRNMNTVPEQQRGNKSKINESRLNYVAGRVGERPLQHHQQQKRGASVERGVSGYYGKREASPLGSRRRVRDDRLANWDRLKRQLNPSQRGRTFLDYVEEREEKAKRDLTRADGDTFFRDLLKLFKKKLTVKEAIRRLNNTVLIRLLTPNLNNSLTVKKLMARDVGLTIDTLEAEARFTKFKAIKPSLTLLKRLVLTYHACGIFIEGATEGAKFQSFDDEDEETKESQEANVDEGIFAALREKQSLIVQEHIEQQQAGPPRQGVAVAATPSSNTAQVNSSDWVLQLASQENTRLKAELEKERARSRQAKQWPEEVKCVVLGMAEQKIKEHHQTVTGSTEGLLRLAGQIRGMDWVAAEKLLVAAQQKLEEDAKLVGEQRGRKRKREVVEGEEEAEEEEGEEDA